MAEEADHLSNEVSVAATINADGIEAKAKSRLVSAADRLLGGIADIPAAYVEGVAERIRARNANKKALIEVEGEAAKTKLAASEEAGDRLLVGILREEERRLENRTAIVIEATEELKRLPPPEAQPEDPESEIEPDWMNIFADHAGHASSDHFRQLWGRILAGEIRQPGSFSLSTLRMISELDREIAELFQSTMERRLDIGFLPQPKAMQGQTLLDLTFLEEVGLLQEANGSLGAAQAKHSDGLIYTPNGDYLLRLKPISPDVVVRYNYIRITRVGREIATILPQSGAEGLKVLAEQVIDQVEEASIHQIIGRNGSNITFVPIEVLKPKPE